MKANYSYKLCAVAYPATKFRGLSVQEAIATTNDYDESKGEGKGFPVQATKLYYREITAPAIINIDTRFIKLFYGRSGVNRAEIIFTSN